jgi:hypothetical protein
MTAPIIMKSGGKTMTYNPLSKAISRIPTTASQILDLKVVSLIVSNHSFHENHLIKIFM